VLSTAHRPRRGWLHPWKQSMHLRSELALPRPLAATRPVGGARRRSLPRRRQHGTGRRSHTGRLVQSERWSTEVNVEHLPGRPSWDCLACARPWPCDPAREALAVEFLGHRLGLALYLGVQFTEAVEDLDLSGHQSAELHERFLSWTDVGARPLGRAHETGSSDRDGDALASRPRCRPVTTATARSTHSRG
jgi:hypothetical protein